MARTLVLGVGNLLLSDDGVGVRAVQKLQQEYSFGKDVEAVDGGTCGLDLLQYLEGVKHLIVVDAAEIGQPPGTIRRYEGDAVPAFLSKKVSPHEINLPELLFSAKLIDIYPQRVVILGVQPATLETSVELSPAVAAVLDDLVERIIAEIEA